MNKLIITVLLGIAVMSTGCSKTPSPRERFCAAMHEVLSDAPEETLRKELEHFDKSDAEEQLKQADYAEYFAYLSKTTGLDMRTIKRTVSVSFEGKSAQERAEILKAARLKK